MTGNSLRGTRVLVVGGAGFIGTNLVAKILGEAPDGLVVVDNLLSSEHTELLNRDDVGFVEGSITDTAVLGAIEPKSFDYVFHLATFHGNQNSIHDPLADAENNLLTTLRLFEALHGSERIKKVVYSSAGCTVAEKGVSSAVATTEDAPISLWYDSPYQISKIVGELYANYYHAQFDLPTVTARFQNVYGPGEILGAGRWRGTAATVWRNVVPTFVYRAIRGMDLVVDNGGRATRDFIYVDDIVRGLLHCATSGTPGEVYNLASGAECSIADLAKLVVELTGGRSRVLVGPPRPWDHSIARFGSTEKSSRSLGFHAEVSLDDGIAATVAWTRAQLPLIEATIAKHQRHLQDPV